MSAVPATPGSGDSGTALLAELASLGAAVRGLGTGGADLGQLAASDSPLSALSAAGFGYVRPMVSFLEEPLALLAGDPGAVSSAAQAAQSTGSNLSTLADTYRGARTDQTSTWSGNAADSYRETGANHADGIAALGQAASTVGTAISSAGGQVAATAQGVRQDITEAVSQMLPVLATARAQIPATHGASMAQAIPRCVQIAESYGHRIAARVQTLLSSSQNLKGFLDKIAQAVDAAKTALQSPAGGGGGGKKPQNQQQPPDPGKTQPGQTQPGQTGNKQTTQQSAPTTGSTADTSNQTASSPVSSDQTSSDQGFTGDSGNSTSSPTSLASTGADLNSDTSTIPSGYPLSSSASQNVTPQSVDAAFVPGSLTSRLTGSSTTGTGSRGGTGGSRPGADSGAVNEDGSSTGRTGAAMASSGSTARGGMMGGAPMGGRGGQRQEDKEHRSPGWLKQDAGLFDPDEATTPAVIGTIPEDEHSIERTPGPVRAASEQAAAPPPDRGVQPVEVATPSATDTGPVEPAADDADDADDLAALAELDDLPDPGKASAQKVPDVELVEL